MRYRLHVLHEEDRKRIYHAAMIFFLKNKTDIQSGKKNGTLLVDVSRLCALNTHDLLTITVNYY